AERETGGRAAGEAKGSGAKGSDCCNSKGDRRIIRLWLELTYAMIPAQQWQHLRREDTRITHQIIARSKCGKLGLECFRDGAGSADRPAILRTKEHFGKGELRVCIDM